MKGPLSMHVLRCKMPDTWRARQLIMRASKRRVMSHVCGRHYLYYPYVWPLADRLLADLKERRRKRGML